MLLGMVAVPDSPSKPFLGYADPTMVFEIFYTIITFNYVLDYCMTDMRTHHVGTKQVLASPALPSPLASPHCKDV